MNTCEHPMYLTPHEHMALIKITAQQAWEEQRKTTEWKQHPHVNIKKRNLLSKKPLDQRLLTFTKGNKIMNRHSAIKNS